MCLQQKLLRIDSVATRVRYSSCRETPGHARLNSTQQKLRHVAGKRTATQDVSHVAYDSARSVLCEFFGCYRTCDTNPFSVFVKRKVPPHHTDNVFVLRETAQRTIVWGRHGYRQAS